MNLKLGATRIQYLAKEKGTSINKMLVTDLGLSKSIVDNMMKGSVPSADKLSKIAHYLDTTPEYLLGETHDPTQRNAHQATPRDEQLDADVAEFARKFASLSDRDKARMQDFLDLIENQEKP